MNKLKSIHCEIVSLTHTDLPDVILYSDKKLNDKSSHRILQLSLNIH